LYSIQAEEIKKRAGVANIDFNKVKQADLILGLRYAILQDEHMGWYPRTLVYAGYGGDHFPLISASITPAKFMILCEILGVRNKADLGKKLTAGNRTETLKRWGPGHNRIDVFALLNWDKLPD